MKALRKKSFFQIWHIGSFQLNLAWIHRAVLRSLYYMDVCVTTVAELCWKSSGAENEKKNVRKIVKKIETIEKQSHKYLIYGPLFNPSQLSLRFSQRSAKTAIAKIFANFPCSHWPQTFNPFKKWNLTLQNSYKSISNFCEEYNRERVEKGWWEKNQNLREECIVFWKSSFRENRNPPNDPKNDIEHSSDLLHYKQYKLPRALTVSNTSLHLEKGLCVLYEHNQCTSLSTNVELYVR